MSTLLGQFFSRHRGALIAVAFVILTVCVVCVVIIAGVDGSKRAVAQSVALVGLPLLVYLSLLRPLIFPLSAYVLLVPFENLFTTNTGGTVTKLVAVVSAAAIIFWMIRNRRVVQPSRAVAAWCLLMVWMGLTVFWAIDPAAAVPHLITYAELILLLSVVSLMPVSAIDHKVLMTATVAGAALAALYGIHEYRSGASQFQHGGRLFLSLGGAGETRVDPNAFAAALLFPIGIVLVGALSSGWSFKKAGFIGLLLVMMGGIYASGSRGGLVAAGVMVAYLLVRSRYKIQLIALSALALLASFLMPHSPWLRFASAISDGGSGRVSIWRVGWEAFKHHWLFGAGVGMFPKAYDQAFIGVYQVWYQSWTRAPHNTLLGAGVEFGVIGVALLVIAWYAQWTAVRELGNAISTDLRLMLESALVGLTVASMFLTMLPLKLLFLLFMIILATRSLVVSNSQPVRTLQPPTFVFTPPPRIPVSVGGPD